MEETIDVKGVTKVDINKQMQEAYLQYSMTVIVGRALPDVRDGLKPVHRRVLFAQSELNNYHDKPYKKSARVVGDVIGKYHPHGENAVYDTIVRLAQDFTMRYPLIDGQGNFGSIDGDSAAASRYTEVRMTQLASQLLEDIDKDTVKFVPNYDDSLEVPTVLPSKVPNLLVNGSSGIAVGMATNIPPHNLSEVVDGCIELIQNPDCTIDDLMKKIPGPDFPTSGVIAGKSGIHSAYKKGRGVISIKAVAEIVEDKNTQQIIISEIPYQVNKARLIESIAHLVKDKKIEGISDIRDESSREGMRIVIQIKRNDNANVVLNRLYKYTQMQISFGIILLALNSRNQPRMFNLKEMISAFIDHRKDVVTKRCIFLLKKAQARAHILEGLKQALDQIDAIIATIKASKETAIARSNLISQFQFSEAQAQAILEMRLQRLTGLERDKILNELEELNKKIEGLKIILGDVKEVEKIIVSELEELKSKFGDTRKTEIISDSDEIEDEDLIADEEMIVTLTNTGYIKRIASNQYRAQKRGGKGLKGMETRETDFISNIFSASTLTTLLIFTDKGKIYWSKVYRLPLGSRIFKGKAIANVVNIESTEKVQAILPIDQFDPDQFVVLVTKKGIIKKSSLKLFSNPRPSGIIAATIDLDDSLITAKLSSGSADVFIATKKGMSISFKESDVRPTGRGARGVKAISLGKDDEVIGIDIFEKTDESNVLIVTEGGYGKCTAKQEYRLQSRGGLGIITQKITPRVGQVVSTIKVTSSDDIILITDKGKVIRMSCSEISVLGRNTQGVRLINLSADEKVNAIALVDEELNEEQDEVPNEEHGEELNEVSNEELNEEQDEVPNEEQDEESNGDTIE